MAEQNIIIIGSGMAGYTLLREIRKLDTRTKITLICADNGDFYSKPMLSIALDKQKTADALVMQNAEKMQQTQNFELFKRCKVTAIDVKNQQVSSRSQLWQYSQLILATGARPFVLPIKGNAAQDILSINHLDHYRVFRQKLEQAQHIAIIGPGLIGCEFANDLLSASRKVSVIGPDQWPISNLLPQKTGQFLQQKLQQQGVEFYLNNSVQSVDRDDNGYRLTLQDSSTLQADLVLSAVGLRANLDLAASSGIRTARGYVTDRYLQTSIPNIYALGDCAEVAGLHLPFILPIMQGARALAKTLTGDKTAVSYPPMPVAIKTPACPIVVSPPSDKQSVCQYTETEDGIKALYYQQDQLTGFALAGDAVIEKQALTPLLPAVL